MWKLKIWYKVNGEIQYVYSISDCAVDLLNKASEWAAKIKVKILEVHLFRNDIF